MKRLAILLELGRPLRLLLWHSLKWLWLELRWWWWQCRKALVLLWWWPGQVLPAAIQAWRSMRRSARMGCAPLPAAFMTRIRELGLQQLHPGRDDPRDLGEGRPQRRGSRGPRDR